MGNLQKKPLECTVKRTNMLNSRTRLCVQARYNFNIAALILQQENTCSKSTTHTQQLTRSYMKLIKRHCTVLVMSFLYFHNNIEHFEHLSFEHVSFLELLGYAQLTRKRLKWCSICDFVEIGYISRLQPQNRFKGIFSWPFCNTWGNVMMTSLRSL